MKKSSTSLPKEPFHARSGQPCRSTRDTEIRSTRDTEIRFVRSDTSLGSKTTYQVEPCCVFKRYGHFFQAGRNQTRVSSDWHTRMASVRKAYGRKKPWDETGMNPLLEV